MRKSLERVITALWAQIPFLASLLKDARIYATRSVPSTAISNRGHLYINPDWFESLSFADQVFVLAHEVMHLGLLHPFRMAGKHKVLWELAADCVVNTIIGRALGLPVPPEAVSPSGVAWLLRNVEKDIEAKIEKLSDSEIYALLEKLPEEEKRRLEMEYLQWLSQTKPGLDLAGGCGDFEGDAELIQEGGEFNDELPQELEKEWRRALARAYSFQRMAGKVPVGLERLVGRVLRPSIDPRALIMQYLRDGLGRLVVNQWRRMSRRVPTLPGQKRITLPTIWILIDTSGSIGQEELELSLGACLDFARLSRINVVCWDAVAYETIKVRRRSDALREVGRRMKGGGGTVIAPALRKVLGEMEPGDLVVVITDGYIYDIEDDYTRDLLRAVGQKSSGRLFLTHDRKLDIPGWPCIEIMRAEV